MYDYLIVGAGLFGAVFAYEAAKRGKKCLVIDKRDHIGGNCYTSKIAGINVHCYGPHIFHTNDAEVWNYINRFAKFNRFTNMPVANYNGEIYPLPFNMNTFSKMWNIATPKEAESIIEFQKKNAGIEVPRNLEEQAISMVGRDIYEKLIKGYTEKQWGRPCSDLPPSIIKRLPVRFTYDNNYFNSQYQGVPIGGYTQIFEALLDGIDVKLNIDFLKNKDELKRIAKVVIFTGCIDEYFDFCYGPLSYRSVRFETELIDKPNYQGNAVVNYTDRITPWTRIVEHKHFEFGAQEQTVISREYSVEYDGTNDPCYPVNDQANTERYDAYKTLAALDNKVVFGGRLGLYRYMDMDETIRAALDLCMTEFQ